jgi:hypothetical protein
MDKDKLKNLCESIEKMGQREHIEILKIIKSSPSNINITENNNGCFINMSSIDHETINNIEKYIDFFKQKEKELNDQELKKNNLLDSLNELDK